MSLRQRATVMLADHYENEAKTRDHYWRSERCHSVIAEEIRHRKASTFIETGTCHGLAMSLVARDFPEMARLMSTELDDALFQKASENLRNVRNVELFKGKSAEMLPVMIARAEGPIVFWLDAHYSGPGTAFGDESTPIMKELDAIFASGVADRTTILIDDARCFLRPVQEYPHYDVLQAFFRAKGRTARVVKDVIVVR